MKRALSTVAAVCSGSLRGSDGEFAAVSTDTRTLAAGDLFVALQGPNFDAHDFVVAAAERGAAAAIVSHANFHESMSMPLIVVSDTQTALTALAGAWRGNFTPVVVGIGGSNGKTTVKEMTGSILERLGPCLVTRGNLNNHIGVPLTLMRLDAAHLRAVIEIGANRRGEVAELVAIARPSVGVITNAGAEHLEGFGDLEGVARSEGEMVEGLPADGIAVINADDAYASLWRTMTSAERITTFGLSPDADFRATDISQSIVDGEFHLTFTLHIAAEPDDRRRITLRLAGRHNVVNALAAAAAAYAAGADSASIVSGLEAVRAVSGRLQLKRSARGAWVIDDSYNANPSSLEVALQVIEDLPGEKWLVLGDMAELGLVEQQSHTDAGVLARRHGIARLFAIGALTPHAVTAFGPGAEWFASAEALSEKLKTELNPGTTVLVKGSRVSRTERIVRALTAQDGKRE